MEAETINRQLTRARDVFLGVLEVLEEGLLVPGDALVDVGGGVGEALGLSRLATEHTARATSTNDRIVRQHRYSPVEVRADLVGSTSLKGMALSAAGLEETSTLASVTCATQIRHCAHRVQISRNTHLQRKACRLEEKGRVKG